jgi:hypothetical protein
MPPVREEGRWLTFWETAPVLLLVETRMQQGYKIRLPATNYFQTFQDGTRTVRHSRIIGRETNVATRFMFFPELKR